MTDRQKEPLRPLDALRLLRDERCTATPTQRHALLMILLRTDNATWEATASMGSFAKDMGVARTTFIRLVPSLVRGHEGIPITLRRQRGRKRHGHRRDANTYGVGIREGWAREAYENRGAGSLGAPRTQPIGCNTHLGIGAPRTGVGGVMRQVLPSDLPSDLPGGETPGVSKEKPEGPTGGARSQEPAFGLALRVWDELWSAKYRRPYVHAVASERAVLKNLGALAIEHGGAGPEDVLRHWVGEYLKDAAAGDWQADERHPIHGLPSRINKYGLPKKPRPVAVKGPEPEPGPVRPFVPLPIVNDPGPYTVDASDKQPAKAKFDPDRLAKALVGGS